MSRRRRRAFTNRAPLRSAACLTTNRWSRIPPAYRNPFVMHYVAQRRCARLPSSFLNPFVVRYVAERSSALPRRRLRAFIDRTALRSAACLTTNRWSRQLHRRRAAPGACARPLSAPERGAGLTELDRHGTRREPTAAGVAGRAGPSRPVTPGAGPRKGAALTAGRMPSFLVR